MLPDHIYALCDFETTGLDLACDHPIEVAILFCDNKLNVVHTFESLIRPPDFSYSRHLEAIRIHGILPHQVANAPEPAEVVERIKLICDELGRQRDRIVLMSDNAIFEHAFMRRLFYTAHARWPFHYCVWDTSLLLEATGIGDPELVHRAMADVGRLHSALVRALGSLPPRLVPY